MRNTIIALLVLVSCAFATERMQTLYKLTHLSPTEVGIFCTNGADPTGNKVGNTLIISCGK